MNSFVITDTDYDLVNITVQAEGNITNVTQQ